MSISPHARHVLEQPMTKERCYDFREIRSWVMYRAWEILETEKVPFRTAISRAWDDAKRKCAELGAIV